MSDERSSAVAPARAPELSVLEAVRAACLDAAVEAYEDAGLQGLCEAGRWECAVAAIRGLDLQAIASGRRRD